MPPDLSFFKKIFCALWIPLTFSCSKDDPDIKSWQSVSSLPSEFRTHHSFGFSLNGKGYLVTGDTGVPRRDFYEYDPNGDQWTKLDDHPGPPRSYGIGDVWEGMAYLGFGVNGDGTYLNDLWAFNPSNLEWSQLASCPCEPRVHPAMVANNGKIYVGLGNNQGNLKDWWEYDIATNTWLQKLDFPAEPRHHPYQFGIGEYVYTGLGHGSQIYKNWFSFKPTTGEWTKMADIPGQARVAGTQFSYEGKGYVLSGDGHNHSSMETGEFWSYDPVSNSWTELPPHPGRSRWAPASFIINGEVYLINGTILVNNALNYQSEVYKFKLSN